MNSNNTLNKFFLLILSLIVTSIFVAAQDGNGIANPDTYQNDTSNWCGADNVWGDGRCNTGSDAQTQWMYEFGWWWQRVTEGDISPCQIPVRYGGNCDVDTDGGTITITLPSGNTITIALQGSPFSGATYTVASDNFNYTTDAAGLGIDTSQTYNLILHGNNNPNELTGGDGNDQIFGYDGNDTLNGSDGNDTINGGDDNGETGTIGDVINGGNDDDLINGGNETCAYTGLGDPEPGDCDESSVGDVIDGGEGNDTINGGNENCGFLNGGFCGGAIIGDAIDGGAGDDSISGGDETCSVGCDPFSTHGTSAVGDEIDGGAGNDTIDGGTESAINGGVADTGDVVDGGDDTDTCTTSDSPDNCE